MSPARVGPNIKMFRQRAGLSLRGFAERVGFSASFISQVEHGTASPSIASLGKMTSALGVTLSDLFAGSETDGLMVIKAAARPGFRSAWSKARVHTLVPQGRSSRLDALMVTLDPGGLSGRETESADVDQFAMVIKGAVLLTHDGRDIRLTRGDSLMLPAGTPHRWQNRGRASAQILVVSSRR